MPYADIHTQLSDADRDLIAQKADEIAALLPFLVNLTTVEKRKGKRLGAKSEKFIVDTLFTIESNGDFKPKFVDAQALADDFALYMQLATVELKLRSILEGVADTRLALMQEMIPVALSVYSNVKAAALTNLPGSDSALERLKVYFKKSAKKK